jgi:hypothetical protein
MSSAPLPNQERLDDLLVEQALFGLSTSDEQELRRLLAQHPDLDPEATERAAAAAVLAMVGPASASMPASLRAKVIAQSAEWTGARVVKAPPPAREPRVREVVARVEGGRVARPIDWSSRMGWLVAAASLGVAAIGWLGRPSASPPSIPAAPTQPVALSPRESMQRLLSTAPDVVRVAWTATQDPAAIVTGGAKAGGEVIWSNERQEGYMVFRGLAANDPAREQYQLWIFDKNQDERFPMHGGVFDIATGQPEVVVPITAKLPVTQPTLFAITREQPGGVWVSDRQRLPLLAKMSG